MAQHTCIHHCPASLLSSKLISIKLGANRPAATTAGRLNADVPDPAGRLPEETFTSQQLLDSFAASGLTSREFVALSGAHTVCCCPLPATFFNHKLDAQHPARAVVKTSAHMRYAGPAVGARARPDGSHYPPALDLWMPHHLVSCL